MARGGASWCPRARWSTRWYRFHTLTTEEGSRGAKRREERLAPALQASCAQASGGAVAGRPPAASGDGGRARGDRRPQPARRDRRLHRRRRIGATAPTAMGSSQPGRTWRSSPDGKSVYVASRDFNLEPTAAPWRASTATRPPVRSASPREATGCVSESGRGACDNGRAPESGLRGGGEPRREERLRRLGSDAVARFVRNPTTGAISQPAGATGCVSEPPRLLRWSHARTAMRSAESAGTGGGEPRREERLPGRLGRRRGAPQPQHDHRGDQPARRDPPAASTRSGTKGAPSVMGSASRRPGWR